MVRVSKNHKIYFKGAFKVNSKIGTGIWESSVWAAEFIPGFQKTYKYRSMQ